MNVTFTKTVFSGKTLGKEWTLDLDKIPEDKREYILTHLIDQGAGIILQRSKSSGTRAQREADLVDRVKKLQDGSYNFGAGGGGGGARQSLEDKAWIMYLTTKGIKEDSKPVNGNTLKRAQKRLCREALIAEHEPGTPERKDVEANIGKYVAEKFEAWLEAEPEKNIGLKMVFDFQKQMASEKTMSG